MTETKPEVVIVGIGQTPVGEHWETSLRDLAVQAVQAARADAGGLNPKFSTSATCWQLLPHTRPTWEHSSVNILGW